MVKVFKKYCQINFVLDSLNTFENQATPVRFRHLGSVVGLDGSERQMVV